MSNVRHLAIHFESPEKQTHAAHLGMWVVLLSEVLLFASLFALYASYRLESPHEFAAAAGHTSLWLSVAMTYTLITSSLLVALSVNAIRENRLTAVRRYLSLSIALGLCFLALKFWEYSRHFAEGIYPGARYHFAALPSAAANAFFSLYYFMTGLHALHVIVGLLLLSWMLWSVRRQRIDAGYHTPLELSALYWHLVDLIWLFLWPLFYLMR